MLTENQITLKYGEPGDASKITVIDLPYPMRIAWDTKRTVTKMQCHKLAADKFKAVLSDLLAHYGLPKLQELGIDLFGGCVNVRLQRGSKTKWSRHSWGIAIDLDPSRNGLKTKAPLAQFSKPEYKPMIDIFYKHGFVGLGPEKGYDWMHFELAI
jgi:D-alanyl-D-alanine carboxypeptidase